MSSPKRRGWSTSRRRTGVRCAGADSPSATGDELVDEAGRRVAVRAPVAKPRRVAEPQPVDAVVGNLRHERRGDRKPVLGHPRKPPPAGALEPSRRAAFEAETVAPRVVL